jgi:hypothetical protein
MNPHGLEWSCTQRRAPCPNFKFLFGRNERGRYGTWYGLRCREYLPVFDTPERASPQGGGCGQGLMPRIFRRGTWHHHIAAWGVCGQGAMRRGACNENSGGTTTFRRGTWHRGIAAGGCMRTRCDATGCVRRNGVRTSGPSPQGWYADKMQF